MLVVTTKGRTKLPRGVDRMRLEVHKENVAVQGGWEDLLGGKGKPPPWGKPLWVSPVTWLSPPPSP